MVHALTRLGTWRIALLCGVTLVWVGAGRASDWSELIRLSADATQARLVGWTSADALKFVLPGQADLELDLQRIVRYGRGVDARSGEGLLLVDGSLWLGRIERMDAQVCQLRGEYFRAIVPRAFVRAAFWSALPVDGVLERFLGTAMSATGTEDLLVRYDGDVIGGTLIPRDKATGTIFGPNSEIALDVSGQRRVERRESLRGIVFCPLLTPLHPVPTAQMPTIGIDMGLRDGSRLLVASVEVSEFGIARLTTLCGAEIFFESAPLAIDAICYLASLALDGKARLVEGDDGLRGLRVNRMEPLRIRDVPWVGAATSRVPSKGGVDNDVYPPALAAMVRPFGEDSNWVGEAIELPMGTQYVVKVKQSDLALRPTRFRGRVIIEADAANPTPAQGRISLVGSDGKIRSTWESEAVTDRDAEGQIFDLELQDTVAIVLEGVSSPLGTGARRVVWIDPVLVQMP